MHVLLLKQNRTHFNIFLKLLRLKFIKLQDITFLPAIFNIYDSKHCLSLVPTFKPRMHTMLKESIILFINGIFQFSMKPELLIDVLLIKVKQVTVIERTLCLG